MANFEYKKDRMCETAPNLARDSIVIADPGQKDFVLWYLWQLGKAPAARKSCSDNVFRQDVFLTYYSSRTRDLSNAAKIMANGALRTNWRFFRLNLPFDN